ncbi:MAG: capsule assembly Wzi family protein [Candidatus Korobacteraceae bacterium]
MLRVGLKKFLIRLALVSVCLSLPVVGQQPDPPSGPGSIAPDDTTPPHPNETQLLKHLAADQLGIWTSPMRLEPKDATWLIPMGGIATGLFVTDPASSFGMASYHPSTYNTASNAGLAVAGGLSGSAYLWGRLTKNERLRETGVLATEAMIDVLGVQYALQYSIGRLTPIQSNYQNAFFQGGTSFPSNHAALTWAFASVVAQEYPNPFVQIGAYGLATGVSLARVAAGQHFLSDVFVGGLIGYQVGRHIYKTRHNANLDDLPVEMAPNPEHLGSTYIPLDSWIYPAMDRLISRGYIDTAFMGLRPWTRMNCARMLSNLDEEIEGNPALPSDISEIMKYLHGEFAEELSAIDGKPIKSIQLSSVYTRITAIAGQPLNDNNLGQTIVNDYGRPYQEGVNNVTGFTARAEDGRFAFYVDGEYQHAPSAPAYPLLTRQVIASVNNDPVQPDVPFPTINQFRLLDTYVTAKFLGQDISVGKQTLDWGPTQSGSMAMSNNAEPFWMLRINQTEPLWVPGVSRLFGPVRFDNFFGQLSGHTQFPQGPYMFGQKFSFKPFAGIEVGTHNKVRPFKGIEIGFSRTVVFAGQNHVPLTFGSFWNSFTSFGSVPADVKFSRNDPGARFATFDFSWRLGSWVTIYTDLLTHDEITPLAAPRRAGLNPGVYLTHFPRIPKLDLRVEGLTTNRFVSPALGGYFFYYEILYRNVYLNNDNLMGSWIGREATGAQAWATYSMTPMTSIQFAYRTMKIGQDYIPRGTTQQMGSVAATLRIRKQTELKGFMQYESWLVPVLNPTRQRDFTASVQVTWFPKLELRH